MYFLKKSQHCVVLVLKRINQFQYTINNLIANKREKKKIQLSKRNLFFPPRHRKRHIVKQISHREPRFIFPRAKRTAYARVLWTFSVWFSIEKKDLWYREREREREGSVVGSKQPVREACGRSVTRWLTARSQARAFTTTGQWIGATVDRECRKCARHAWHASQIKDTHRRPRSCASLQTVKSAAPQCSRIYIEEREREWRKKKKFAIPFAVRKPPTSF